MKQFRKACQWYETLGRRMAGSGHCLDVFACSLDQVGIAEMHDAVSVTGLLTPWDGVCVLLPGQFCVLRVCDAPLMQAM